MPARINTRQINVERRNGNITESNNNKSTNQVVEVTTIIREVSDWESNVGQLTGEVNNGKVPNFTHGKWRQIFTQHQFAPRHCLPQGQHKIDKQQQRAVQWRKKQAYRRQGEKITKASKNMKRFKHKLCPTSKELSGRVDRNWLNMKRGAKKKGRQESAQSYREESAKEAAKVDSLITDWTRGGLGTWTLRRLMESSEYYRRTIIAYRF